MEQPAHPPIYSLTAPDACWEAKIEKTKKKQINQAFKCNMDILFHLKHTFINISCWSSSYRKERSYLFILHYPCSLGRWLVVRALASHQCGLGSNPSINTTIKWVEFVVGSLPCSKRSFSRYSGFTHPQNQHFQIQFNQGSDRRRTTMWMYYLYYLILPSAQSHQLRDGPYAKPSGNFPQMFCQ